MGNAKIAVVGAGLMGHGIAQVFALAGHDVTITDSFAQNLDTAKSRIAANLHDLARAQRHFDESRVVDDRAVSGDGLPRPLPVDRPLRGRGLLGVKGNPWRGEEGERGQDAWQPRGALPRAAHAFRNTDPPATHQL